MYLDALLDLIIVAAHYKTYYNGCQVQRIIFFDCYEIVKIFVQGNLATPECPPARQPCDSRMLPPRARQPCDSRISPLVQGNFIIKLAMNG